MLRAPALAAHLDGPATSFVDRLAALSGTFAAVHTGDVVIAAVDRIRSTPLFYGRDAAGTLCLSDDARWLADATDARLDDPAAAAEFMLASATTGASTLSSSVRQMQAGEAVTFESGQETSHRYFRYGVGPTLDASEDELVERGVRLFEETFDRLIASLRGRPVAVPLSGGMDSRLIAAMLVRGGRTDTVCFSYGRARSFETRASRRVAASLGLRWSFVPYSNREWHRWFASEGFQRFRRTATGLTTIEHEQDWPAVRTLRERGLGDDAIFVPGHAGDFLGGSHLPTAPVVEQDPAEWLWRRYYIEWPTSALDPDLHAVLRDRIVAQVDSVSDPVAAFTHFGWQERQAKMIANSVRVYEHHGFDWRLPFWADPALLDFWGRVPVRFRRGRRLYFRVLRRLMGDALFDLPSTLRPESRIAGKVRRLTDRDHYRYGIWLGRTPLLAALRTRIRDLAAASEHPVVGPVVDQLVHPVGALPPQRVGINGLLALSQLDTLCREIE
jgi:asparagine synthase (glutamine-hydrolysing)